MSVDNTMSMTFEGRSLVVRYDDNGLTIIKKNGEGDTNLFIGLNPDEAIEFMTIIGMGNAAIAMGERATTLPQHDTPFNVFERTIRAEQFPDGPFTSGPYPYPTTGKDEIDEEEDNR
jgi:hypothetical protein